MRSPTRFILLAVTGVLLIPGAASANGMDEIGPIDARDELMIVEGGSIEVQDFDLIDTLDGPMIVDLESEMVELP